MYAKTDSKKLNVIGGNKNCIYDSTQKGLYTYVNNASMSFKNLQAFTNQYLEKNIKIVDMMGGTSLIYSIDDYSSSLSGFLLQGKGIVLS